MTDEHFLTALTDAFDLGLEAGKTNALNPPKPTEIALKVGLKGMDVTKGHVYYLGLMFEAGQFQGRAAIYDKVVI